jgi:hypothetical protein
MKEEKKIAHLHYSYFASVELFNFWSFTMVSTFCFIAVILNCTTGAMMGLFMNKVHIDDLIHT